MKSINGEDTLIGSSSSPEKNSEQNKLKKLNEKSKHNEDVELKEILSIDFAVYEKLMSKFDDLKNLFTYYSKIGDKVNTFKIELTSFLRFIKDMDLLETHKDKSHLLTTSHNITQNKSFEVQSGYQSGSLSPSKRLLGNTSTVSNIANTKVNSVKGFLNETDVSLIFFQLTGNITYYYIIGIQNFDQKEKNRKQFDKNKGITTSLNDCVNVPNLGENQKNTHTNVANKMDFNIFIKSFELLAKKIYHEKSLDEAVLLFFENVLTT